ELQGISGRAARGRGVDDHGLTRIGGELHRLEVDLEVAHHRVVQLLAAGAVEAHIVVRPAGPERLAPGGQLADQVAERLVARVLARLQTQYGGNVVGRP